MTTLLALSRAEFELVNRLHRYRLAAHVITLVVSAGALFVREPIAYVCSVAAFVTEAIAYVVRQMASERQSHASEAMRRARLMDALGHTAEPLDLADIRAGFSKRTEKAASGHEDPSYYATTASVGPKRLVEILQESAFWSKHLYEAASVRGLILWSAVLVVVLGTIVFGMPFFSPNLLLNLARAAALFLAFVSATDGLTRALEWRSAAKRTGCVDRRLEHVSGAEQEPLLAVFADYSVITAAAPPIPPSIYKAERTRLNELWRDRKNNQPGTIVAK